jgi:hypothetical protein
VSEDADDEDLPDGDDVPLASQEAADTNEHAEVLKVIKDVQHELLSASVAPAVRPQPLSDVEHAVFEQAQDLFELTVGPNEHRLFALHAYYSLRDSGFAAVKAVEVASCVAGIGTSTLYRLRQEAETKGYVPDDGRTGGDGATQRWILARDEGLQHQLREFIFENTDQRGEPNITVPQITAWINNSLLREGIDAGRPGFAEISERTTHRWLKKLGFVWKVEKRAGFVDGHESEENVSGAHGRHAYLKEMKAIRDANKEANEYNAELLAAIKELQEGIKSALGTKRHHAQQLTRAAAERGTTGDEVRRMRNELKNLAARQKPRYINVFTDECIYHTNNDTQGAWRIPGVLPKLPPKKTEGQGIMVIVFATEHGEVRLNEDQLKEARARYGPQFDGETRFKLEIGKARDGYLNGDMYQNVVKKLFQVLQFAFPGEICNVVLDQSSVHFRYGADAIRTSTFNLNDDTTTQLEKRKAKADLLGFEMVEVRSGTWHDEDGVTHTQEFYYDDGRRKGAATILTERGVPEPDGGWTRTSALQALSEQPDFQAEQSALQRMWHELTGGRQGHHDTQVPP